MSNALSVNLSRASVLLFCVFFSACTTSREASLESSAEELGALTTQLHEDMLLRHETNRFAAIASENYVVMIPGGYRESKRENIDGASNFNVESVRFSNVAVQTHETSAVVTGTWSLVGHLGQQEMSGDYEFMSFYEYTEGHWTLVSESVTRRRTMARALSE